MAEPYSMAALSFLLLSFLAIQLRGRHSGSPGEVVSAGIVLLLVVTRLLAGHAAAIPEAATAFYWSDLALLAAILLLTAVAVGKAVWMAVANDP